MTLSNGKCSGPLWSPPHFSGFCWSAPHFSHFNGSGWWLRALAPEWHWQICTAICDVNGTVRRKWPTTLRDGPSFRLVLIYNWLIWNLIFQFTDAQKELFSTTGTAGIFTTIANETDRNCLKMSWNKQNNSTHPFLFKIVWIFYEMKFYLKKML